MLHILGKKTALHAFETLGTPQMHCLCSCALRWPLQTIRVCSGLPEKKTGSETVSVFLKYKTENWYYYVIMTTPGHNTRKNFSKKRFVTRKLTQLTTTRERYLLQTVQSFACTACKSCHER
jgi:hypothetical protein